ncbi:MAG TPA: hypothetical protein VMU42_07415, partial [Candidatus Sulfotelmatobacter sp.]|nr:hypothetical protein [Candidatus Sulfotelmatobacter sp.]
DLLGDYAGSLIVISHDRDFLDRVATSVISAEAAGHWQEYAGGYSDMMVQRSAGTGVMAPQAPAKSKGSPPKRSAEPAVRRRRLSFKDQHALQTLPVQMAALQAEIGRLQQALADPGFYARDAGAFAKASSALATASAELAAAEDQWLTLELLREELEG